MVDKERDINMRIDSRYDAPAERTTGAFQEIETGR
jgi:hypothetical protein